MKKWLYIALAVVVVGLAASFGHKDKPVRTIPPKEERAAATAQARLQERLDEQLRGDSSVIDVDPTLLLIAYSHNEIAANRVYKGKWVRLTARLTTVATDVGGDPYLAFSTPMHGQVQAHLYNYQLTSVRPDKSFTACSAMDAAAQLQAGQIVSVECKGLGVVFGVPQLGMCLITSDL